VAIYYGKPLGRWVGVQCFTAPNTRVQALPNVPSTDIFSQFMASNMVGMDGSKDIAQWRDSFLEEAIEDGRRG
jgi:hypothetical protein